MVKRNVVGINLIVFFVLFILFDLLSGYILIPYNLNLVREKHAYFHHALKRNKELLTSWGGVVYPFSTNSLGFRDSSKYNVDINSHQYTILLMGDSHTEGVGVPFEKTFAGILQKAYLEHDVRVLNAAVVSYSPLIHYLKASYIIKEMGLIPNEIWVFVDISDLQNEIAYQNFTPQYCSIYSRVKSGLHTFLNNSSFVYNYIYSHQQQRETKEFIQRMTDFNSDQNLMEERIGDVSVYKDFFSDLNDDVLLRSPEFHGVGSWYIDSNTIVLAEEGIRLGQNNIRRLKLLCDSFDIDLKLSVHPWQMQVMRGDTNDWYVNSWRDFSQENEIDFINLFPVFIDNENPAIASGKYYIYNDNHWNILGHQKVADYLIKKILEMQ